MLSNIYLSQITYYLEFLVWFSCIILISGFGLLLLLEIHATEKANEQYRCGCRGRHQPSAPARRPSGSRE